MPQFTTLINFITRSTLRNLDIDTHRLKRLRVTHTSLSFNHPRIGFLDKFFDVLNVFISQNKQLLEVSLLLNQDLDLLVFSRKYYTNAFLSRLKQDRDIVLHFYTRQQVVCVKK